MLQIKNLVQRARSVWFALGPRNHEIIEPALLRRDAGRRALGARAGPVDPRRGAGPGAVRHLPRAPAGRDILAGPHLLHREGDDGGVRAHHREGRVPEAPVEHRQEARQGAQRRRVVHLGSAGEAHDVKLQTEPEQCGD